MTSRFSLPTLAAFALAAFALVAGCGGGAPSDSYEGTWKLARMTCGGAPVTLTDYEETLTITASEARSTVKTKGCASTDAGWTIMATPDALDLFGTARRTCSPGPSCSGSSGAASGGRSLVMPSTCIEGTSNLSLSFDRVGPDAMTLTTSDGSCVSRYER